MRIGIGMGVGFGRRRAPAWPPSALGAKIISWHDHTSPFGVGGWTGRDANAHVLAGENPSESAHNGRRTLVFDGSTQYLTKAFALAQPSEVWLAARFLGAYSADVVLCSGGAASGQVRRNADAEWELASTSLRAVASVGGSLTDRWVVVGARFAAPNSMIWEGAADLGIDGGTGTTAADGLTLGARISSGTTGLFAACEIGEAIVLASASDANDRVALVSHLSEWL